MIDLNRLHDAVALALREPDPGEAVRVLCSSAAEGLVVDGVSISTMTGTQHRDTLCASDQVADDLEELQFTLGEGPCFEAFNTGAPVLVPHLATAPGSAWPFYASRVVEQFSARAVFVFPLTFGSLRLGTMGTYRTRPGPLGDEAVAAAVDLAETAALVLLGLKDPTDPSAWAASDALVGARELSVSHHDQVHAAAGMLASQLGLPTDAAFDRMRGHAFVENRLLTDVASDVLAHRLRLDSSTA